MDLRIEKELSNLPIIDKIDKIFNTIMSFKPFEPQYEKRVLQKLRLEWNYHSNAIEGNKLDYGETVAFLMTGMTAKGKSLKDYLDIKGHNEAINFLLSMVKDQRGITEMDIRALHEIILVEPYQVRGEAFDGTSVTKTIKIGEYKTLPNHVKTVTGEIHYYATPEETPAKMADLIQWYKEVVDNDQIHPLVIASLFHHKFVAIHPFDDGNGRLARILMNLILMQNEYPPVVIKTEDRLNYYALLSQADTGSFIPFIEAIGEYLLQSLELFLKAIKGISIDDGDEVDKEIALFKMELANESKIQERKHTELVVKVIKEQCIPILKKISNKLYQFNEFFFDNSVALIINFGPNDKKVLSLVNEESNQKIFDLVISEKRDIKYIVLRLAFMKFKNADSDFNVEYYAAFDFGEYEFYFNDTIDEQSILSKLYHEVLSGDDINYILKYCFQSFKSLVQDQLVKE